MTICILYHYFFSYTTCSPPLWSALLLLLLVPSPWSFVLLRLVFIPLWSHQYPKLIILTEKLVNIPKPCLWQIPLYMQLKAKLSLPLLLNLYSRLLLLALLSTSSLMIKLGRLVSNIADMSSNHPIFPNSLTYTYYFPAFLVISLSNNLFFCTYALLFLILSIINHYQTYECEKWYSRMHLLITTTHWLLLSWDSISLFA